MRFQVPQFIEVETKIFGPLTLKQFLYLAGASGAVVVFWSLLPFFLVIIFGAPVVGLGLALAFYRVNNQSFAKVLENGLKFYLSNHLFLWKKETPKAPVIQSESAAPSAGGAGRGPAVYVPKLTRNSLKDLSWSLDIKKEV